MNIPLGGVMATISTRNLTDDKFSNWWPGSETITEHKALIACFKEGNIYHSGWEVDNTGESLHGTYQRQNTTKGVRICFLHNWKTPTQPFHFNYYVTKHTDENSNLCHSFLAQINNFVAKLEQSFPHTKSRCSYDFALYDSVCWFFDVSPAEGDMNAKNYQDLYLFIEDPV
ncbi:hypothetical protein M422DRAFT_68757, partial [Sphaerobolus stellatus SS14]